MNFYHKKARSDGSIELNDGPRTSQGPVLQVMIITQTKGKSWLLPIFDYYYAGDERGEALASLR